MIDKNWLDSLSDILSKPLPGTEAPTAEVPPQPEVFRDNDDDDSLLDRITDILSKPLPGTANGASEGGGSVASGDAPENPGEAAVREAAEAEQDDDAEPVSTTAAAGADWMQREYERFNLHQEQNRQAFADRQRIEQERFAAYQQAQLQQFTQSQARERNVFRQHQEARAATWRHDLRQAYRPMPQAPRVPPGPGMMMPPPPPPPWWRKR